MTPPPSAGSHSPDTFPIAGHFSDEDIHELLGAMGDHTHHHPITTTTDHHEEAPMVSSTALPGSLTTDEQHEAPQEEQATFNEPDYEVSEQARAQARSERKRSREKQRRSDVNKQFADLTQLLRRIEAEDLDNDRLPTMMPVGGPTNRVDLIARTIVALERMHDLSSKRKREVVDLNRQLEDMKKMAEDTAARLKEATVYQQGPPKPVMMMVPMMVNPNSMQPGAAATAAPGFAMASPFMQQQQASMFMPPMAGMPTPMPQSTQTQVQPLQTQPAMAFPQMMFASTAPPPPPAPAPSAAAPGSPKQQGQKQPAINNNGGGNLAHCA